MSLTERPATAGFHCAQCDRPLPAEEAELGAWRPGDVVHACPVDETTAMTLLCPECLEAEHAGDFDAGEGD